MTDVFHTEEPVTQPACNTPPKPRLEAEGTPLRAREDSSYGSSDEVTDEGRSFDELCPTADEKLRRRAVKVNNDSPPLSANTPHEPASAAPTATSKIKSPRQATRGSLAAVWHAVTATVQFLAAVWHFLLGRPYDACPYFADSPQALAQVYSLCTVLWLWHRPHYRTGTYQDDMKTNLRNVAIPGTGTPLSILVQHKLLGLAFLLVGYPAVALVAGIRKGGLSVNNALDAYVEQLLRPQDWFSFWRLNCTLASFHALVTEAKGFSMEDKWTFLTAAKEAGVPVSPWLDTEAIVVKDKNEEGGMGIHFYGNAVHGGQWIIQPKLNNAGVVKKMLPANAPLSTLRVITASRGGMRSSTTAEAPLPGSPIPEDVEALSCVFRAGRAGASTDHDSILFDVDLATGKVLNGTTNMHWYQLGLDKTLTTPWLCLTHDITHHPDSGQKVTGHVIPDIDKVRELCEDAHYRLLPDVPLAGWDVAITEEAGMCLLEVNLSCNFFRGKFDQRAYFELVGEYFSFLDRASRK